MPSVPAWGASSSFYAMIGTPPLRAVARRSADRVDDNWLTLWGDLMFTSNPFAELSALIPPSVMQTYIVVMTLMVVPVARCSHRRDKAAKMGTLEINQPSWSIYPGPYVHRGAGEGVMPSVPALMITG